ncbi:MAG: flavin reductase family protein [Flavobacteriales bacterium]
MLHLKPKDLPVGDLHQYLLSAIGPRPIALASTINENGVANLSPFSFFNVFSANPPIAIFSPARRVRNNTTKHTLENVLKNKEVVINVVSHDIVQQTSLSSTEYGLGIDEFIKSGLTAEKSELIKPYRVKESPVQMECVVNEVIALGQEGGAGNLVICEIKMIHINTAILDENGKIDPNKIDLVGRMGGNWYCRASNDSIFEVEKPIRNLGIGVDQIPDDIRHSHILSGNDLGILGNIENLPTDNEIKAYINEYQNEEFISNFNAQDEDSINTLHQRAKDLLKKGQVKEAWKILLIDKNNRI